VNEALGKSLNAIRFHLQAMINLKFAPNILFIEEKQAILQALIDAKKQSNTS
jgi:hypothetical protein